MGKLYSSAIEALADASCCNIQVDLDIPAIPFPAIPTIALPTLPPLPKISYFCPCDEEDEPSTS